MASAVIVLNTHKNIFHCVEDFRQVAVDILRLCQSPEQGHDDHEDAVGTFTFDSSPVVLISGPTRARGHVSLRCLQEGRTLCHHWYLFQHAAKRGRDLIRWGNRSSDAYFESSL